MYYDSSYKETNKPRVQVVKLKSSLRRFYGSLHKLVDLYGISDSQMTSEMLKLSKLQSRSPPSNLSSQIILITRFELRQAARREQNQLTLTEHQIFSLVIDSVGIVRFLFSVMRIWCTVICLLFVFAGFFHVIISFY